MLLLPCFYLLFVIVKQLNAIALKIHSIEPVT